MTYEKSLEWPRWFDWPVDSFVAGLFRAKIKKLPEIQDMMESIPRIYRTYYIFHGNYISLKKFTNIINIPDNFNDFATLVNSPFINSAIGEETRLLHNLLASAMMLVNNTRRTMRIKYEDSDLFKQYNLEVTKRFSKNTTAQFVQDLRNFTLHRTLPVVQMAMRMEKINDGKFKSSLGFGLEKKHLLEWDNWSEIGKMPILEALDNDLIDIELIIDSYFSLVENFQKWLMTHLIEYYDEEIRVAKEILNIINRELN